MNDMDNNNVDVSTILEQLKQIKRDNEQFKQFKRDNEHLKQDIEQFKQDLEQFKQDNEQLKQDNQSLQLRVAQLEAKTHNNGDYNNTTNKSSDDNDDMSVYQRPHVQKRQKVSQDEERIEGDDSDSVYGGIPSHLRQLICRLVIRCLAKHLPARH